MTVRLVLLLLAVVAFASPSHAQIIHNEDPPAPTTNTGGSGGGSGGGNPAPKLSLDGGWVYHSDCSTKSYDGQLSFSGSSGSFFGTTSGVRGKIVDVQLSGRQMSFTMEYSLLGKQWERWTGSVASGGKSMSGNIVDSWDDHCSFTATRQ